MPIAVFTEAADLQTLPEDAQEQREDALRAEETGPAEPDWMIEQRQKHRDLMRARRGTDLSPRNCLACGREFTPARSHARCCSARCRAAWSRSRRGC